MRNARCVVALFVVFGGMAVGRRGWTQEHRAGVGHTHRQEHGRDRFHNPTDTDRYIAAQEDATRAAWQKPDDVVRELALRAGQTVCDIGAGPGYFSLRLARAVGDRGRVYAVDVDGRILSTLRDRLESNGVRNVTPVLGLAADPLLPLGMCDVILIVNTYHHFPDPPAYLRGVLRVLAPNGTLANIDFEKRDTPHGPPVAHRISREEFLRHATAAGLTLVRSPNLLPHQYFLIFRRQNR